MSCIGQSELPAPLLPALLARHLPACDLNASVVVTLPFIGEARMMKRVVFLVILLMFSLAPPALGNIGPSPETLLAEVLILPIMMIVSLVGGGYAVLNRLGGKKSGWRPAGAIIAIFISTVDDDPATLVALIFAVIALARGLQMIRWGWRARSRQERPEHLTQANPWRLIPAGVTLVPVTIFLLGIPFAFHGYSPALIAQRHALIDFVTYQLAYADLEEWRTGEQRFHKITKDDPEHLHFASGFPLGVGKPIWDYRAQVEYGPDGKTFTVRILPHTVPFFPYNYFSARPSYYADQTGQIRMIYVHNRERCPADAPVTVHVGSDILGALKDEDKYVRGTAANALGRLKDPRAVEPLIAALRDEDWAVRWCAEASLERITEQSFGGPSLPEQPDRSRALAWQSWWEQNKDTARNGTSHGE